MSNTAAATMVAGIANTHGAKVAALLGTTTGLTDFEIADQLGMYLSSVNATRNTLVKQGVVRDSGRTRPSGRGGVAKVWEVTA